MKKTKVLIAYNQPTGGQYKSYDGRYSNSNDVSTKKIDLSEEGVIEEFDDIRNTLNNLGYETTNLNVAKDFSLLIDNIKSIQPDVIFNLVESVDGEAIKEVYVAGLYELLNISYTGNEPFALSSCLNKHYCKQILKANNIKIPNWRIYKTPNALLYDSEIEFPVIVKPSKEDASVGISEESVVYDDVQLKKRVEFMYETFNQPILVEEYIEGREINSAILGDKEKVALPLSEIDFSTLPEDLPKIVTYDGKWIKDSVYYSATIPVCPANLEEKKAQEIKEISLRVANIFNLRDYARVDLRLSKNGTPYVIEVNPNPDISKDAGFPRAAKAFGLEYDQMLDTIIKYALERRC